MIRITIQDNDQTVSFLTQQDTLHRLIAGCSADPSKLGELLIATDLYQQGIAASLMADLIEFDKRLHREGSDPIRAEIADAQAQGRPYEPAFQVVDQITEKEALRPQGCEVVLIDLTVREIRPSAGLHVPATGEVRVRTQETLTDRSITYILPKTWSISTAG